MLIPQVQGHLFLLGAVLLGSLAPLPSGYGRRPKEYPPGRPSQTESLFQRLHFTFGAGRRVCPGFHLAERNLFIAISRILWAFNITRSRGRPANTDRAGCRDARPDGEATGLPVSIKYRAFLESILTVLRCRVTPRDLEKLDLIRGLWTEAKKDIDAEGNFTDNFFSPVLPKFRDCT